MYPLYMESLHKKKVELIETVGKWLLGAGGSRGKLVKGCRVLLLLKVKEKGSEDLTYNMVTIVESSVLGYR